MLELFDGNRIAPGVGRDLFVGGGGYPEQLANAAGQIVYYPGGSSTLGELKAMPKQSGGRRKKMRSRKRKSVRRRTLRA